MSAKKRILRLGLLYVIGDITAACGDCERHNRNQSHWSGPTK